MKRNRKSLRLRTKLVWKEGEERKSSRPLELPGAKELKTTPLVFSGLLGVEETQLKIAPIPTTCLIVRGVAFPIHFALGFLAVSLNIFVRKNENHASSQCRQILSPGIAEVRFLAAEQHTTTHLCPSHPQKNKQAGLIVERK
jgi:hypothetical protein